MYVVLVYCKQNGSWIVHKRCRGAGRAMHRARQLIDAGICAVVEYHA